MEKRFEIPKNPEGVAMAQKFQDYLKSLGVDASKLLYSTMLKGLEFGGIDTLKQYCESQLDKLRSLPDEVVDFI